MKESFGLGEHFAACSFRRWIEVLSEDKGTRTE